MIGDFLKYQAQTSPHPLGLQISRASGSYIYDTSGRAYLDFVAGVSACTLGHCHPRVVDAVKRQAEKHMHVMVYGEFAQAPAVDYCRLLASVLPPKLDTTYLVNSGTEAVEGALKLARRFTGRSQIVSAKRSYHGNTMGSLSVTGCEERKRAFRPLVPDIKFVDFNSDKGLSAISDKTAAVILETIQGGAGFILPDNGYLEKIRKKCDETGALLILDEIQPGFGRTGKLFAFEHYNCVPDILAIGKGMASGLPAGAFVASNELMKSLQYKPKLGHITTFGGNSVVAAASLATLKELTETDLIEETLPKERLFRELLQHSHIKEIRGRGLMLALILTDLKTVDFLIKKAMEEGLILFRLLFEPRAVRISPPLTLSTKEIEKGCNIILDILNELENSC